MTANDILVGTSGYDETERKEVFYPEILSRKDFLTYYSTRFNAFAFKDMVNL